MKRYILFLWGVLGVFLSSYAQNVYTCRYWFDQNHSALQTESFTDSVWHGSIDVAHLSNGLHTLNLQVKDTSNRWNSPRSYMFIKLRDTLHSATVAGEPTYICWMDNDYATKQIGLLGNGHILLDVDTLGNGLHTVTLMLKQDDDYTSLRSYMFLRINSGALSTDTGDYAYICWFDQDYSTRTTGLLGDGNIMLDVDSLRSGLHVVNIVVKRGSYSTSTHSYMFVKVPDSTVRENMEYYCWFDNNYSTLQTGALGNGHILLDVNDLRDGVHTVNIAVKHGEDYTSTRSYMFVKVPDSTVRENMEYYCWFDSDYASCITGNIGNGHILLDVAGLRDGVHTVNISLKHGDNYTSTRSYMFVKVPDSTVRENMEYYCWFDSDYSTLQIGPLGNGHIQLDVDSLAEGMHTVTVMVKGSGFSPSFTYSFEVPNDSVFQDPTYMEYLVRFVNYDSTVIQWDSVMYGMLPIYTGSTPHRPSTPQYSYVFRGWNPTIDTVRGDATYMAVYDSVINTYIVRFVNYDGTLLQQDSVAYGDSAFYRGVVPQRPSMAPCYYTFAGWQPEVGIVEQDTIFVAQYDSTFFAITCLSNDTAMGNASSSVPQYGVPTVTLTAVANAGYRFVSWNDGDTANPRIITLSGDTVFTALFEELDDVAVADTIVDVVVACDSYTWINGVTYTESNNTATYRITQNDNDYYDGYGTTEGGDEYGFIVGENGDTIIYIITVERKSAKNEAKTAYLSGVTYQLNLTIHNSFDTTIYATICADSVYTENGFVESIPGVYTNTHQTINGCDSTVTLVLSIDSTCVSSSLDTIVDVVVTCDSYTWIDGVTYTESTNTPTYRITVNNGGNEGVEDSISGFEVSANIVTAVDKTTSNSIYNSLRSSSKSSSRDTIMVLNLTINYSTDTTIYDTICANSMYVENGFNTNVAGIYTDTLQTVNGCDSIVTLVLTVNSVSTGTDSITAYDSYTWIDGVTYTANNNTATYTLTNAAGCDSIVTLNLTINNSTTGSIGIDSIIAFYSYTWIDGVTYTESTNTPTYHLYTVDGLDSIAILNLSIINIIDTIGDGGDIVITPDPGTIISLDYGDTILLTALPENCYHFADWSDGVTDNPRYIVVTGGITLSANYARNDALLGDTTVVACSSYTWINGETYTTSVVDTFALTSANGCDSLAVLNLTISNAVIYTDEVTACGSYTWIDGYTYTSSTNTPTYTITSESGCDSIINLHLTIKNNSYSVDTHTACNSYTWIDGNTYVQSTSTPIYILTAANGCDSIVRLNLTIKHSATGTDVVTACDSYTWIDGVTYTASNNTATYTLTAANGCDSVVTLNLTINNSTTTTDIVTACNSYTWIDGVTYTASNNTATYTLTNAVGCDSVVTLNLTINNSTTGTDVITACDSYTWIDGITYTESNNTATYTLTNADGCDSVVTLNLTVNYSNTGVDTITACDSYTWIDGITYTESNNTATYTLTNAAGCDSVVTLNLTVNYAVYDTIVDTAVNEYVWNGTTYTESGTYQYIGTTAEGCDSIVTLILTIQSVGIDAADELETLAFYPNPTSGTITFNRTDIRKVEVMDGMGRVVATFENSNVIDLAKLSKGYYTLRITTNSGVAIRKVIRN